MEDLKKIQEFFSKPLNEEKEPLDIIDLAKVVKAVQQTGHPVTVLLVPKFNEIEVLTGMNAPDDMLHDLSNAVDSLGYGRNDIIIAGDSSNLSRREYSDIRRVNGGHKDYFEESVSEADLNDPVAMKMRAAKMKADKLAKMRAANAGDDGNDKFFDAAKLRALEKKRAQIMRDMEQEAELEGGPVADKYGDMLNKIDKAISMLKEYNAGIYYNPTKGDTADKAKEAGDSALKKVKDMIQKILKEEEGYSKFLKDDPEHPGGKTKGLTPDVMNKILMNVIKDLDETTDYMKRRRAMDDYAVSKKDKPAKSYNPYPSGKTDYQKRREKDLEERIAEALNKINEELCPKGKAYIKKRQAAGEKSSAYLSGRAVKVCKGQMKG